MLCVVGGALRRSPHADCAVRTQNLEACYVLSTPSPGACVPEALMAVLFWNERRRHPLLDHKPALRGDHGEQPIHTCKVGPNLECNTCNRQHAACGTAPNKPARSQALCS